MYLLPWWPFSDFVVNYLQSQDCAWTRSQSLYVFCTKDKKSARRTKWENITKRCSGECNNGAEVNRRLNLCIFCNSSNGEAHNLLLYMMLVAVYMQQLPHWRGERSLVDKMLTKILSGTDNLQTISCFDKCPGILDYNHVSKLFY